MHTVKRIKSTDQISPGERYVLVMRGSEKKMTRHSRGVTIVVASPGDKDDILAVVEFATAVAGAESLADKEGIPVVYVID